MVLMMGRRTFLCITALIFAVLAFITGCDTKGSRSPDIPPGIVVEQAGMAALHERITKAITSAPSRVMGDTGLVGTMGGVHLKVLKAGLHEVFIPVPQLADTQIPISYAITTIPPDAGAEYRLRIREGLNVVVSVRLEGKQNQEIQINWASIILITHKGTILNLGYPEAYLQETPCVQSEAGQVKKLAESLWPDTGGIGAYAKNIQAFIRNMKQNKRPRSLDALGILDSGANWICTANANLAAALLRAKDIPARSVAVIPPIGHVLEMHRIVEYFDAGQWVKFDPSSLQKNIPMKPWQSIIMARTTIADEDIAMKPRMGVSRGCPYGQELEFLDGGITLWGKHFYWTTGKSFAQFEASSKIIDLARKEWDRFLVSGKLSRGQMNAPVVTSVAAFLEALGPGESETE